MNNTHILIQARLSSSRFPRKMLEKVGDFSMLEYIYRRCKVSNKANSVAIVTSVDSTDDELAFLCLKQGIPFFRGDLYNVLDRYITAAEYFGVKNIIRVCGDSPFVDVDLIDKMIQFALDEQLDYCVITNCINGFMSEFIKTKTLKEIAQKEDLGDDDIEHVTKYIRDRVEFFKCSFIDANLRPKELENYTLTVDYPVDIEIARKIYSRLKGFNFKSKEIIKILQEIKG